MNFDGISAHAHSRRLDLSRRQFTRAVGGAAVAGATIASGIVAAQGPKGDTFTPVPIPGGTPLLGGIFHVFGPSLVDPVDAEPSSITNFNGFIGLAFISGMVTRTNTTTGESLRLPFINNDMRFMIGTFRATDGRVHQGAFAFIWVDVFLPGPGSQIHDLNPSSFPPHGLFWTVEMLPDGIQVQPGSGNASMQAFHIPVLDYGNIANALFGGGPPPIPAMVSFRVEWSGVGERVNIRNDDPVYGGFAGQFVRNEAKMEWTATAGPYQFVSDPLSTSSSTFAEIGHERNGSFYP